MEMILAATSSSPQTSISGAYICILSTIDRKDSRDFTISSRGKTAQVIILEEILVSPSGQCELRGYRKESDIYD